MFWKILYGQQASAACKVAVTKLQTLNKRNFQGIFAYHFADTVSKMIDLFCAIYKDIHRTLNTSASTEMVYIEAVYNLFGANDEAGCSLNSI